MIRHHLHQRVAAATAATAAFGLLASGVLVSASAPAAASSSPPATAPESVQGEATDVPVLGVRTVQTGQDPTADRATVALHGVRRVEGGTVLYYSAGYQGSGDAMGLASASGTADRWSDQQGWFASQTVVDQVGRQVYTTLVDSEGGACLCTDLSLSLDLSGRMVVFYQVVPELPAGLETVDVEIGHRTGMVFADVPVEDGLLEPTLPASEEIEVGSGWPEVDLERVAAAAEPQASIYPLTTTIATLDESLVEREGSDEVSLDLAADVLFGFDSAELVPEAQERIADVAATINERAAGGSVSVVGHTDSEGTDAYNDDLSLERAQAVAAVLDPLVEASGVELVVEGRGEREPVADNETDEGRAMNRRVSVVFTPQEPS